MLPKTFLLLYKYLAKSISSTVGLLSCLSVNGLLWVRSGLFELGSSYSLEGPKTVHSLHLPLPLYQPDIGGLSLPQTMDAVPPPWDLRLHCFSILHYSHRHSREFPPPSGLSRTIFIPPTVLYPYPLCHCLLEPPFLCAPPFPLYLPP